MQIGKEQGDLDLAMQKLASNDFVTQRKAQNEILKHGENAIPRLLKAVEANGTTEKEIVIYLVGELSASDYARLLVTHAHDLGPPVTLRYLSNKGLARLSTEQVQQLIKTYEPMLVTLREEERNLVAKFLARLTERP